VLTEGFQSAFMACVVLAGIGVALALVLLGGTAPGRLRGARARAESPAGDLRDVIRKES
jgi:hypothetical protein